MLNANYFSHVKILKWLHKDLVIRRLNVRVPLVQHLPFVINLKRTFYNIGYSLRSVALEMVLQAAQSPKEPFQEPLTYGRKIEVICILVPRSKVLHKSYI